jgi:hypothetical protein
LVLALLGGGEEVLPIKNSRIPYIVKIFQMKKRARLSSHDPHFEFQTTSQSVCNATILFVVPEIFQSSLTISLV